MPHARTSPFIRYGSAVLVTALAVLAAQPALASQGGEHADPASDVVLALAIILLAAKAGGDLMARVGQPAVLGELLVGTLLGNVGLLGLEVPGHVATNTHVDMLARLGVILLLFEVGLESTVGQMLKVGLSALLVVMIGVIVPFVLGWCVGAWLLPERGAYVHAFLGATLSGAAVLGKQACALGAIGKGIDRISIGIGMVPRGEVGLIFANIGLGLVVSGQPVIDRPLFSAVVVMVVVTTILTPPALKWSLSSASRGSRQVETR